MWGKYKPREGGVERGGWVGEWRPKVEFVSQGVLGGVLSVSPIGLFRPLAYVGRLAELSRATVGNSGVNQGSG